MKLVSVADMKAIEEAANRGGLSYRQMMENAGRGLADAAYNAHSHSGNPSVLGLVGPGNNGGDTLIALAILAQKGWHTTGYLVKKRPEEEDLSTRLIQAGGKIALHPADEDLDQLRSWMEKTDIVLDGILGTGIQLPLRSDIAQIIQTCLEVYCQRANKPVIVAVDCPSGVDSDSGEAFEHCIPADLTVCMAAVKAGLLKPPAANLVGQLHVVDIGLDPELPAWNTIHDRVVDRAMVEAVLPRRSKEAYKGTFGTALLIVGSTNYTGAALLAGRAAYRIGAGLVTLAVPAPLHTALAGHLPEATWLLLPHSQGVIASSAVDVVQSYLDRATAILIGPGWAQEETTGQFLARMLAMEARPRRISMGFVQGPEGEKPPSALTMPPTVVDADALKLLSKVPDWTRFLPANSVLTPHPGEMSVLTGLPTSQIQKDRMGLARRFAQEWGYVVVLKGANTVVANPDGRIFVIPVASPALARAGTGDVLAGTITGLLAQGVSAFEAAYSAAWIHAMGGLLAEKAIGNSASVLAGNVIDGLVEVLNDLYSDRSSRKVTPA